MFMVWEIEKYIYVARKLNLHKEKIKIKTASFSYIITVVHASSCEKVYGYLVIKNSKIIYLLQCVRIYF